MSFESDASPNARLPEDLEEGSLTGMEIGAHAWSVPWAMEVDTKRRCWLKASFTGHDEPGGTVSMLVTRVEGGFEVDISRDPDERWSLAYATDADEIDAQDPERPQWLPVLKITR